MSMLTAIKLWCKNIADNKNRKKREWREIIPYFRERSAIFITISELRGEKRKTFAQKFKFLLNLFFGCSIETLN